MSERELAYYRSLPLEERRAFREELSDRRFQRLCRVLFVVMYASLLIAAFLLALCVAVG